MSESWNKYWNSDNLEYWMKPADEVLEFIDELKTDENRSVLNLGCGLGRHAIAFAEKGFHVTALDSSETAVGKLNDIAKKHGLNIKTVVADYMHEVFPKDSFDIVISYNVIYHGMQETFQNAIDLCCKYLKPDGTLFFTCPSRSDAKYGSGKKVAENTYESLNSVHPGDIHYFADEEDILDMCSDFTNIRIAKNEYWWNHNGVEQFSSYYIVTADKK